MQVVLLQGPTAAQRCVEFFFLVQDISIVCWLP